MKPEPARRSAHRLAPTTSAPTVLQIDHDGVAGAVLDGLMSAEVSAFGRERKVEVGELLYRAVARLPTLS